MLLCELILLLQSCTVISDAADDIINVMITHARWSILLLVKLMPGRLLATLTTGSYGIENLILEGYAIYIILDI
jgi:hypothetical protein